MGLFDKLTQSNIELFAARHYKNSMCVDLDEFRSDLSRFKYVKKLVKRYIEGGELKTRLILNHLITIYNTFEISGANRILNFKMDSDEQLSTIKPFLVYLNFLPEGEMLNIETDLYVTKKLQEL